LRDAISVGTSYDGAWNCVFLLRKSPPKPSDIRMAVESHLVHPSPLNKPPSQRYGLKVIATR